MFVMTSAVRALSDVSTLFRLLWTGRLDISNSPPHFRVHTVVVARIVTATSSTVRWSVKHAAGVSASETRHDGPPPNQGVAAAEARDVQLGTSVGPGAPSFLVVLTTS
jgi:hypothetical protein